MAQENENDVELVRLLQELETLARDLVSKAGGCPPFGGIIKPDGQVTLLIDAASVGAADKSTLSIEGVLGMIRREAASNKARAAGMVNMAYVTDDSGKKSTAIVIALHHTGGRCIDYAIPFSKSAAGAPRYADPIVGIGSTRLV